MNIDILVRNKIASAQNYHLICGNSDYTITFDFDSEWSSAEYKTARFIWNGQYVDVVFSGNVCAAPMVDNATMLAVGVYTENLRTTTPALISCEKSILCGNPLPDEPTPDVYNQIIALLNERTMQLWKPTVDSSGNITWVRSEETTAPESQNIKGDRGARGTAGVGISSATIDADGNLIFTKTDNTTTNAGDIIQIVLDAIPSADGVSY